LCDLHYQRAGEPLRAPWPLSARTFSAAPVGLLKKSGSRCGRFPCQNPPGSRGSSRVPQLGGCPGRPEKKKLSATEEKNARSARHLHSYHRATRAEFPRNPGFWSGPMGEEGRARVGISMPKPGPSPVRFASDLSRGERWELPSFSRREKVPAGRMRVFALIDPTGPAVDSRRRSHWAGAVRAWVAHTPAARVVTPIPARRASEGSGGTPPSLAHRASIVRAPFEC
jgi:hypothetical protein